ncbi:MAG: putative porin [Bacteroidales bacterium]
MKHFLFILIFLQGSILVSAQQKDTIENVLYAWKLVDGFLEEEAAFDTVIDYVQMFNPIERHSICYSYLGNVGSPWKTNDYFSDNRIIQRDFIFDRNYLPYLITNENTLFYHAKKPYFDLNWATGTKKRDENLLSALYTQNINKKWNIGVKYKLISSLGEIPRSKVAEHSFNMFTSYKGEKYSMHAVFNRNRFRNEESGGINDTLSTTPEFAEPLLQNARSVYFNREFMLSQQYKFGFTKKIVIDDTTTESKFIELGRLNYILSTRKNYRYYNEDEEDWNYYRNTYYQPEDLTQSIDSINQFRIDNTLYWTFKEIQKENFNGRLTIGGTYEYLKSISTDKSYAYYKTDIYNNFKLSANLDARTKNFIFTVNGYYYPIISASGSHKAGSFYLGTLIDKAIKVGKWKPDFYFKLSQSNLKSDLFDREYYSMHFRWNNDFKNRLNTEFKTGFSIPQILVNFEFGYGLNQNEIYYDSLALPTQFADFLTIRSLKFQKDFKIGGLRIINKVLHQKVNNENQVISLPVWSFYHSLFFDLKRFLDQYSIEAQLGYELYYSTNYYAPGFMPSTGVFFQQRIRQTGEFPMINGFLNMRIKTVLLFFKFENIYNKLVLNKYYYYVNNYPVNSIAFKFGVSWRFKD